MAYQGPSTVETDGVTMQGNGSVSSKIALKAGTPAQKLSSYPLTPGVDYPTPNISEGSYTAWSHLATVDIDAADLVSAVQPVDVTIDDIRGWIYTIDGANTLLNAMKLDGSSNSDIQTTDVYREAGLARRTAFDRYRLYVNAVDGTSSPLFVVSNGVMLATINISSYFFATPTYATIAGISPYGQYVVAFGEWPTNVVRRRIVIFKGS